MSLMRMFVLITLHVVHSMQPDVKARVKYIFRDEMAHTSPLREQCIQANFAAFEKTKDNEDNYEWYEWVWKVVDYWTTNVTRDAEDMECPVRWCIYLMGSVLELSKGEQAKEIQDMLREIYHHYQLATTCPTNLRSYVSSTHQSIEQKLYAKYMNGYNFKDEYKLIDQ